MSLLITSQANGTVGLTVVTLTSNIAKNTDVCRWASVIVAASAALKVVAIAVAVEGPELVVSVEIEVDRRRRPGRPLSCGSPAALLVSVKTNRRAGQAS